MKINDNGTDRNMTEAEQETHEAWQKLVAKDRAAEAKIAADKSVARQVVLDRLGITSYEAALLLS